MTVLSFLPLSAIVFIYNILWLIDDLWMFSPLFWRYKKEYCEAYLMYWFYLFLGIVPVVWYLLTI